MPTAIPSGITSVGTESQRGVTSFADMRTGLFGSGDPSQNYVINGLFEFSQRGDFTASAAAVNTYAKVQAAAKQELKQHRKAIKKWLKSKKTLKDDLASEG